ncbi:regulator SirB [Dechloromonas sp. TW-R-39-2]|uniref:SirB2 family protein n=1 Tax=Dechloromonas sp. TW-R-39-2 TaxID=2654218 RepID=UPI00193EA3EA|nr:SirB2 family protein [Dechloromonas sp. TW-R-39-2]QRM20294.1 regulator SirB [Dechloromonas sp. TW-R-39-2]
MSYLALKHIHVTCVLLSGLGFCLRAIWMLADSSLLKHRLVRLLPHLVDTTLLGSAVLLAISSGQYPFVNGWLTAKFLGLLAYIVFGTFALKRGRTKAIRAMFLGFALLAYAYIISVALTRNPLPGL